MKFHKQLKVPGFNQEQIIEGLKATGMKMRLKRLFMILASDVLKRWINLMGAISLPGLAQFWSAYT